MFFSSSQAPKNRYREWTRKRCQQLAPSRFIDITVIALQHNYTQIFTVRLFDRQLSENRNTVVKINLTHLYKERLKQRKKCCWVGHIGSPILLVERQIKKVKGFLSIYWIVANHLTSDFFTTGKRNGGLRIYFASNLLLHTYQQQQEKCYNGPLYFRDCYVTLSASMYVVFQGLR